MNPQRRQLLVGLGVGAAMSGALAAPGGSAPSLADAAPRRVRLLWPAALLQQGQARTAALRGVRGIAPAVLDDPVELQRLLAAHAGERLVAVLPARHAVLLDHVLAAQRVALWWRGDHVATADGTWRHDLQAVQWPAEVTGDLAGRWSPEHRWRLRCLDRVGEGGGQATVVSVLWPAVLAEALLRQGGGARAVPPWPVHEGVGQGPWASFIADV